MAAAETGDTVEVHFSSRTAEGEPFESTRAEGCSSVIVVLGEGKINPAFEEALCGMSEGEKKEVELSAADAYGKYNKRLVFKMIKASLHFIDEPSVGDYITVTLPNGKKATVRVVEINRKTIKVDGNHPMAGKDMIYELELVKIVKKNGE